MEKFATTGDPTVARCFRGHNDEISSLAFHPEMKQIVSCGYDKLVKVWSFKPQVSPFSWKGHKGPVLCVDYNTRGTKIVSCGTDGTVKTWPIKVKPKFKSIKAHVAPVR